MAFRKDILLDDNNDPICKDGDFVTGISDQQNSVRLTSLNKGELKESPTVGVGLIHFLKKVNITPREIEREVKLQHQNDGYKVSNFEFTEEGELNFDIENNY